ncbi:MAG: methyl- -binding domain 4-like [Trebouxia sp. A1-2]|nr:MAG: methyl- -binding domain 4-like [Trebouxia sp. A1-2]
MPDEDQPALGCSKCRYSQRGCKRCKDPAFNSRKRGNLTSCSKGREPKRQSRQSGQSLSKASHGQIKQVDTKPGKAPETNNDTKQAANHKLAVSTDQLQPLSLPQSQPKAPPPDSATTLADHQNASAQWGARDPNMAHNAGQSALDCADVASERQAAVHTEDDAQTSATKPTSVRHADEEVMAAAPASPGTEAPQAMAAPRHKVKQRRRRSAKKPSRTRAFLQPGSDPRQALWHPPASPYGLIEEYLYQDPWKLLVACMLLNVTSGLQVRKVIWRLFDIWPTPEAAAGATGDTLVIVEKLIQPLGLFRKRTMAIKRFSQEYLEAEWLDPIELHGIGQYASDAYFIFCRGNWRDVDPSDKDLLRYQQWLHSTGGEGNGLERDVMPHAADLRAVNFNSN